jgi:glucose-6-phosphate isomerase
VTVLDGLEAAAGLAVYGTGGVPEDRAIRSELIKDGVPGLLAAKDPTLWGPDAESEAKARLGWVDTFRRSRDLLPQLAELRAELADLDHVVLAGMGGSSLAPEVIARTLGRPLTVLDTTDPGQVRRALNDRLERTVVVISSKSGSTVETDSVRRAYWQALLDDGLTEAEAGRRFVIVTDPGSPLTTTGREMGAYVVLADPEVGGRYSALTAFGLVPTALAGVDVAELLDQAEALSGALQANDDNPGLALGTALGAAARAGRDKLALVEDGTGIQGLADWIEQLVAGVLGKVATGKDGKGILPVVLEDPTAPVAGSGDVLTVSVGGSLPPGAVPGGGVPPDLAVNGPLGAQFLTWEFATAIAGRVLGINPFGQPDVQESKENTNRILAEGLPEEPPTLIEGAIEVYAPEHVSSLADAVNDLIESVDEGNYLAVMAYLDRFADSAAAQLRPMLAGLTGRPVTFGWGPRFLHSTGQYHKGGPPVGRFLQITGEVNEDLAVPGKTVSFYPPASPKALTFGVLQKAQAAGDRLALAQRAPGRVLRLHLTDRAEGIAQLLDLLR